MQDTRTTAEKLKDLELMKREIASSLSSVAEPQIAYQIIQRIIESPLNLNNSLLRFLAQRGPSIAEQFKKNLAFGVAGDINDIDRIVEFIKNLYSDQQGKFQTTKSYMNSISSYGSSSKIISANDIDSIILGLDDLIKNIHIITQKGVNLGGLPNSRNILQILRRKIDFLKNSLPKNNELQEFLSSENIIQNRQDMTALFDILEKLPKYSEVMALIGKIKQYLSSNNQDLALDGIKRLSKLFDPIFNEENDFILFNFSNNVLAPIRQENINKQQAEVQYQNSLREIADDRQRQIGGAKPVFIINPENEPVWVRSTNVLGGTQQQTQQQQPIGNPLLGNLLKDLTGGVTLKKRNKNEEGDEEEKNDKFLSPVQLELIKKMRSEGDKKREEEEAEAERLRQMMPKIDPYIPKVTKLVNNLTNDEINQFNDIFQEVANTKRLYEKRNVIMKLLLEEINNNNYTDNKYGIGGLGLRKRRGRPRGSGIAKPKLQKVPNFVGFGINEINQKQLGKGIVKIRRNTKSNFIDMPSKRVSSDLQNILKTIIGGGMPKYNELGKLSDEEKDYLHKLLERSDLNERISVPTPSKDQQEKDIHNFEVMKGQIMSGNDSVELVKKFKLLIRKLTKQGLLPKSDVEDILETLADLNY
jgi:hypothetical protein